MFFANFRLRSRRPKTDLKAEKLLEHEKRRRSSLLKLLVVSRDFWKMGSPEPLFPCAGLDVVVCAGVRFRVSPTFRPPPDFFKHTVQQPFWGILPLRLLSSVLWSSRNIFNDPEERRLVCVSPNYFAFIFMSVIT